MIAFGAGGAVHESNCDFCGACIDVCPTATLLEKPNKWIAKTEEWVSTTCNSCSVGCTLSMGVRNGKVVMVKPDRLNPVSDSQICVRGRFHYDAVTTRERLTRHLVRQGELLTNTTYDAALEAATGRLAGVIRQHGPESVGFLVAPWATNEEAYLTQHIARNLAGTENVDSTAGPVSQAVEGALTNAFGTHVLPSSLTDLATASAVVVIADDLESSHNVAALRIKDAVVYNGARLIVVSARYGEVCDFIAPPPAGAMMPSPQRVHSAAPTGVWLRPSPGGEAATVSALAGRLNPAAGSADAPGVPDDELDAAAEILRNLGDGRLAVVYAPSASSPLIAGVGAGAAANLAIAVKGADAANSLHVLPIEANVNGVRDMGATPGAGGKGLRAMLSGGVRALVCVGDNPMMLTPDKDSVEASLRGFEALIVIDSLRSETAELAHVVFADTPSYGKDGTRTSADRRVGRVTRAEAPTGDQRDSIDTLNALAAALAERLDKPYASPGATAEAVMTAASAAVDGYSGASYSTLQSGRTRALGSAPSRAAFQPVVPPRTPSGGDTLLLTTSRSLYTSLEGATIRSAEADKLHREEFLEINPEDAAALGVQQNRPVVVRNGTHEVVASAALTDAVAKGSVYLPFYYEGGAVNRLLPADGAPVAVTVRPA
jgi:predicted molibdopterin-dependent oxidoreductase YjgC